MSHVSIFGEKITNVARLAEIAEGKGYVVGYGTVKMYGQNTVESELSIRLPGWNYPVAVTKEGEVKYDYFGSKYGSFDLLGELLQEYNVEMVLDSFDPLVCSAAIEDGDKGEKVITLTYFD
jgi:hypothetical protein